MKKTLKMTITALLGLLFLSCGNKSSDTLRMSMVSEPDSFFPWKSAAAETQAVTNNIFEGLVKYDENGSLYPALAESWEISSDFRTYTFKLRQGVKFHNGADFTSADCVYTFKNLAGLDLKSSPTK